MMGHGVYDPIVHQCKICSSFKYIKKKLEECLKPNKCYWHFEKHLLLHSSVGLNQSMFQVVDIWEDEQEPKKKIIFFWIFICVSF